MLLPDSPLKAKFLSEDERLAVVERIKENETGLENKERKLDQVRRKFLLSRFTLVSR